MNDKPLLKQPQIKRPDFDHILPVAVVDGVPFFTMEVMDAWIESGKEVERAREESRLYPLLIHVPLYAETLSERLLDADVTDLLNLVEALYEHNRKMENLFYRVWFNIQMAWLDWRTRNEQP